MLGGERYAGERWKTSIGLISKKSNFNFARAAHFFCTILCRCFARLQRETSTNFFMEEMSYVFSFTFFFTAVHFLLASVAASISHFLTALQNFHVLFQQKKCLLCFLSLALDLSRPFFSLSFAGLPPTFYFSLSFSCSIFQICGHEN